MAQKNSCEICKHLVAEFSAEFPQLCVNCGQQFLEMIRAVAELSIEMASAYGLNPLQGRVNLPGIAVEEIEIRMELNRLKGKIAKTT
jgi:hypothetical protein